MLPRRDEGTAQSAQGDVAGSWRRQGRHQAYHHPKHGHVEKQGGYRFYRVSNTMVFRRVSRLWANNVGCSKPSCLFYLTCHLPSDPPSGILSSPISRPPTPRPRTTDSTESFRVCYSEWSKAEWEPKSLETRAKAKARRKAEKQCGQS